MIDSDKFIRFSRRWGRDHSTYADTEHLRDQFWEALVLEGLILSEEAGQFLFNVLWMEVLTGQNHRRDHNRRVYGHKEGATPRHRPFEWLRREWFKHACMHTRMQKGKL